MGRRHWSVREQLWGPVLQAQVERWSWALVGTVGTVGTVGNGRDLWEAGGAEVAASALRVVDCIMCVVDGVHDCRG